jgi:hypothetical protein
MPDGGWNLAGFDDWLDIWINNDAPDQDTRLHVAAWLVTRVDNPYDGMKREGVDEYGMGHPLLWGGWVPDTVWGSQGVYCSYLIFEETGTVRCNSLATLSWP